MGAQDSCRQCRRVAAGHKPRTQPEPHRGEPPEGTESETFLAHQDRTAATPTRLACPACSIKGRHRQQSGVCSLCWSSLCDGMGDQRHLWALQAFEQIGTGDAQS